MSQPDAPAGDALARARYELRGEIEDYAGCGCCGASSEKEVQAKIDAVIQAVRAEGAAEAEQLRHALRNVLVHTARLPHADRELLDGLLTSIERIARAALGLAPSSGTEAQ